MPTPISKPITPPKMCETTIYKCPHRSETKYTQCELAKKSKKKGSFCKSPSVYQKYASTCKECAKEKSEREIEEKEKEWERFLKEEKRKKGKEVGDEEGGGSVGRWWERNCREVLWVEMADWGWKVGKGVESGRGKEEVYSFGGDLKKGGEEKVLDKEDQKKDSQISQLGKRSGDRNSGRNVMGLENWRGRNEFSGGK